MTRDASDQEPGDHSALIVTSARAGLEELERAITQAGIATTFWEPDRVSFTRTSAILVDLREATALFPSLEAGRPWLALVGSNPSDVARAFGAGASDVLALPWPASEAVSRVLRLLRLQHDLSDRQRLQDRTRVMLEVTRTLASSLDFHEILFAVVRRIADTVKVDRVSTVLAPPENESVGYVIAASDDQQITNLKLDLTKYPEIREVLRTCTPLTIQDVSAHPVFDDVRADVQTAQVRAIMLLPIVWENRAIGVLSLRVREKNVVLSDEELEFCQTVANSMAVAVRNARAVQALRDHTQQETFARFEAERRLQSLQRYADLFASSADGIVVAEPNGCLLFANPRAYAITGYPEASMEGRNLLSLVHADDRQRAQTIWQEITASAPIHNEDLRIVRRDGSVLVCSLSVAVLHDGDGAILASFRDVTTQRETEAELVRTKDFLESLIEASPDGIVAADMQGSILLFNEGAERIYGYRAGDVVGKMNVRALYPEGGAREVMAMIVAPQHGGVGRLESVRFDALSSTGEPVPISLSAALVYQDGQPIASFGIFTDLRDKIRAEERLAAAQERLALSEKQALIAELAGTAAHELNQPLTSVMGYAELLKRKTARESAEHRAADIIVRESERMAEMVRKIGKITRYETKSYVGQQKILDLDKATDGDGGSGRNG